MQTNGQLGKARILLQWLATIEGLSRSLDIQAIKNHFEEDILEALSDGRLIAEALNSMDVKAFDKSGLSNDPGDAYQAYRNFKVVLTGLKKFYLDLHGLKADDPDIGAIQYGQTMQELVKKLEIMKKDISETSIRSINQAEFVNIDTLIIVLELCLGVAVNCERTEELISSFTDKLDENTLDELMSIT